MSNVPSVNPNLFNHKLNEIAALKAAKRQRRFDKAVKVTIWSSTYAVAAAALVLGGWSNAVVAHWLGVPGLAGWAAALVLDGIWLVSLAIVQLHRHEPWRALTAYQATVGMVVLSATTNFAHGLIRFESSWRGVAAGLLFALLPVSLKWLVSVSTKNSMGQLLRAPDARNRIRQAGQITAELELNQILAPLANRVNHPAEEPEPGSVSMETAQVERVQDDSEWLPEWVNQELPRVEPKPALEPARTPEVPKVEPPVVPPVSQPTTRQERVTDLARRIAERGGQLNSVSFSDLTTWYGIDASKKSTLSALRKAGHQAYLDGAKTGLYL